MVRITNKSPSLVSNFGDIKLWIANGWILPSGGVACAIRKGLLSMGNNTGEHLREHDCTSRYI